MMSNVLDAIEKEQKASQEVAKQVEELAQLRRSDIIFQSQKDDTCSTLADTNRECPVVHHYVHCVEATLTSY